jgi:hypothetical protein
VSAAASDPAAISVAAVAGVNTEDSLNRIPTVGVSDDTGIKVIH